MAGRFEKMDSKVFLDILEVGEGQKIEFKENYISKENKNELRIAICAFANSEGGRIFVGIGDNKKVIGANITDKTEGEIEQVKKGINPIPELTVDIFSFQNKSLIVIDVKKSYLHYMYKGVTFERRGDVSQKLETKEEIEQFQRRKRLYSFEDNINILFNFERDFDKGKFSHFLKLSGISDVLDERSVLQNIGVMDLQGNMSNCGTLFFSKKCLLFC